MDDLPAMLVSLSLHGLRRKGNTCLEATDPVGALAASNASGAA
jgi:hypothetical protein